MIESILKILNHKKESNIIVIKQTLELIKLFVFNSSNFNKKSFMNVYQLLADKIDSNQKIIVFDILLLCCDTVTPKFVMLTLID